MTKSKKYTVILAYPDYMARDWCETFTSWEDTCSVEAAILSARLAALEANDMEPDEADDFAVLAVFRGHLTNLTPAKEW